MRLRIGKDVDIHELDRYGFVYEQIGKSNLEVALSKYKCFGGKAKYRKLIMRVRYPSRYIVMYACKESYELLFDLTKAGLVVKE